MNNITEEETAHVKWVEEMQTLRWNNTDRSEILDMLLETYGMTLTETIEGILNHSINDRDTRERMEELISSVKNRRKGVKNG